MSFDLIKQLRAATSLGINDCKKALDEAQGNYDSALQLLKKKGSLLMEKKSARTTSQGAIDSYIHFGGNLGALVEINCETDFVARTDIFKKFVKDVAMQVAAANPKYLKTEDIPQEELDIVKNKDEYIKTVCLMNQSFIKNSKLTIDAYLREVISQTGENILIKKFIRFSLGEDDAI